MTERSTFIVRLNPVLVQTNEVQGYNSESRTWITPWFDATKFSSDSDALQVAPKEQGVRIIRPEQEKDLDHQMSIWVWSSIGLRWKWIGVKSFFGER